ncbi:MAG: flavin prenyltransferase UbiX [Pirellulaceae bacterium]|nr:UbiX family flavin prenyltransferase [Planctomycetales bacterium]
MTRHPIVVAITGASGAAYATRLLQILAQFERPVHLTISPSGAEVLRHECAVEVDLQRFDAGPLGVAHDAIVYHHYQDFMAPIASGSFLTGGMVICPCSGSTLSSVAHASSTNLIQRAADVHLKERRRLILVPRETPLSLGQLENMKTACQYGAVILPAMPGWYHGVDSLQDLIDFVVARILDQLEIPHELMRRWGET